MWQHMFCVSVMCAVWRRELRNLHPAFEDGTDTGFRNVGQLQFDAGEIPKRIYTGLTWVGDEMKTIALKSFCA